MIKILITVLFSLAVYSQEEVVLTKKQYEELKKLEKKSKDRVQDVFKPTKVPTNKNVNIIRSDKSIIEERMNEDDVITVTACYNFPVMFTFGPYFSGRVKELLPFTEGDRLKLDFPKEGNVPKVGYWVTANVANVLEKNAEWNTGFTVMVQNNEEKLVGYNFYINVVSCQSSDNFPKEVRITYKSNDLDTQEILAPEDRIIKESNGYTRQNDYTDIEIYYMTSPPGSNKQILHLDVVFKEKRKKKFSPYFVVLDYLQNQVIPSRLAYDQESSQYFTNTDKEGRSHMRFRLTLDLDDKYLNEHNFVYLMLVDHTDRYYQYARVPLRELRDKIRRDNLILK